MVDQSDKKTGTSRFAAGLERWENQVESAVPFRVREVLSTRRKETRRLPMTPLGPMLGAEPRPPLPLEPPKRLEQLVANLRRANNGFPLTAVLHGWRTDPAESFLSALRVLVDEKDAIWLIPRDRPHPETAAGVVLNLERDTDRRICQNLVADIVFFPADHPIEAEQAQAWEGRVRSVVVQGRTEFTDSIVGVVYQSECYRWVEGALEKA